MEMWISEEKQRGATIIMSSHQVSSIVKTCDNFHVFENGTVAYTSVDKGSNTSNESQGYTLNITGVDKPSLDQIFNSDGLPQPVAWHNSNFQHTLSYTNYQEASSVMATLLNNGVVISEFGESANITESLILSLLQKGEKK
jgi:ABC-type multidrug transport system ATPase subunit